MAKRFGKGNDSTQDVSLSQFVPPKPPTTRGKNPVNDMSLWGGVVVGTSDFAPPVLKRPPVASNRWKWIAGGGVVVAAIVAFLVVTMTGGDKPTPTAAPAVAPVDKPTVDKPAAADKAAADKVAADKVAADKAAADKAGSGSTTDPGAGSGSATAAAKSGSAGPTVAAVTGDVDAITGVGSIIRPAKKKATGKKTVKKTAKKKRK